MTHLHTARESEPPFRETRRRRSAFSGDLGPRPPWQRAPWADIPATGPMLRTTEAMRYIGFSASQFYLLVRQGLLPVPLKLGAHATGVPKPWLDAVIEFRAREAGQ